MSRGMPRSANASTNLSVRATANFCNHSSCSPPSMPLTAYPCLCACTTSIGTLKICQIISTSDRMPSASSGSANSATGASAWYMDFRLSKATSFTILSLPVSALKVVKSQPLMPAASNPPCNLLATVLLLLATTEDVFRTQLESSKSRCLTTSIFLTSGNFALNSARFAALTCAASNGSDSASMMRLSKASESSSSAASLIKRVNTVFILRRRSLRRRVSMWIFPFPSMIWA
mmetsp:Transcript_71152/g.206060  ORF Transcript_71152/g.206060 Transcript_71152/m.206060 type:complete len:232 (+) Transcript_71152:1084-1779(+)